MANDEEQLKSCLTKIIGTVETCLQKLTSIGKQQPTDVKADYLLQNSQLNNNIYTFALSNEENELLSTLTSTIQGILKHNFKHLSEKCLNYIFNFFHTYHYDSKRQEFTSSLSMGVLHSFHRELQGLLASLEAFPAAFNGQLDVVKKFIRE
ncbi:unnamed protein product, partial [Rotaria sp. Silwood1]